MQWSTKPWAPLGFLVLIALLIADSALAYRNTRTIAENTALVAHTYEVFAEAAQTLSTMIDAETGQRGYLITGRDSYLEPYNSATKHIRARLLRLQQLTVDNPNQQRRIALLVDPALSYGLPPFLTRKPGLNSGLMIAEVTSAALMSENKQKAFPASVDSTPTSANQEDHVSMGTTSARHARQALGNAQWVIAVELLCASQALDLHRPLAPSPGTGAALAALRREVPPLDADRLMQRDLRAAHELVAHGGLRAAVEAVVGPLH
jgi:histidine ammonia-lyase